MRRIVAECGHCLAVLKIQDDGTVTTLDIVSPSVYNEDGGYGPAESVTLGTRENVVKLQEFLNENLNAKEAP